MPIQSVEVLVRRLRLSAGLAVLMFPCLLSAQPPSQGLARDAATGRPLYAEQRLAVSEGQTMLNQGVSCEQPVGGGSIGQKMLGFSESDRQPELDYQAADGERFYTLSRESRGWVLQTSEGGDRGVRSRWIRLRKDVLLDDALLLFLSRQRESLLANPPEQLWWAYLPELKVQKYAFSVQEYQSGAVALLRFELHRGGSWLKPLRRVLRLDVRRDDGRWLRYQGPPTCPDVDAEEVVIDFRY